MRSSSHYISLAPRSVKIFLAGLVAIIALAFSVAALCQSQQTLGGLRTVRVASFGNGTQALAMQQRIVERLNRSHRIHAVADAQPADAVLHGAASAWVTGKVSLNPRSNTVSYVNYRGYLSVELVGADGQTLWSYLAVPSRFTMSSFADDLADQIVAHLLSAVDKGSAVTTAATATSRVPLHGAGATFPAPLYLEWFEAYGEPVTYDAVGSESGLQSLAASKVDFAASDMPLSEQDAQTSHVRQFATVLGGVVPIFNLPGSGHELNLTPEVLAGIYSGAIRRWNDPRIRATNRGTILPNAEIAVIHRDDGSGTTFVWSSFLSAASPEWKNSVGAGTSLTWPVGTAAKGNDGVADLVKKTGYSIGYVEMTFAIQHELNYAAVKNPAGQFVKADLTSITAAAEASVAAAGQHLPLSILNAPGKSGYPISSFTWILLPEQGLDAKRRSAVSGLLDWMLTSGQKQCASMGYAPLPHEVAERELQAVRALK